MRACFRTFGFGRLDSWSTRDIDRGGAAHPLHQSPRRFPPPRNRRHLNLVKELWTNLERQRQRAWSRTGDVVHDKRSKVMVDCLNVSFAIVSKVSPRGVVSAQGRVLLQAAGQWKIPTSGTGGQFGVQTSDRTAKEPEARSSEKVSKKTQGKGEEHPQRACWKGDLQRRRQFQPVRERLPSRGRSHDLMTPKS